MWHLPNVDVGEARNWTSREWVESKTMAGVRFEIARVSFLGRIELLKTLRGLMSEMECRAAGSSDRDRVERAWLGLQAQRTYIEWGLTRVDGLLIDGENATPESLLARGPEELCVEIAAAVKDRSFLNEEERKN
jgi:hypothetical protein